MQTVKCEIHGSSNSELHTKYESNEAVPDSASTVLIIPELLEKILGYLSLSDLMTTRLVNRNWNQASQPQFGKICHPIAFPGKRIPGRNKTRSITNISIFIKLISTSFMFPFIKYIVKFDIAETTKDLETLNNFFQAIAALTSELTVCCTRDMKLDKLEPLKNVKFSQLIRLNLHMTSDASESSLQYFSKLFESITTQPILSVEIYCDYYNNNLSNMLISAFGSAQVSKIIHLTLHSHVQNEHLFQLNSLKLKLKTAVLEFCTSYNLNLTNSSIEQFLNSQAESLEQLQITSHKPCRGIVEPIIITFPKMKKLTSLKIIIPAIFSYPHSPGSILTFCRISYSTQFPNLKRLSLTGSGKNIKPFLQSGLPSLTHLEVLETRHFLRTNSNIKEAGILFPNVRKLTLSEREDAFLAACLTFANVEELEVKGEGLSWLTKMLTGYTKEELDEADWSSPALRQMFEEDMQKSTEFLEKLKVLRLIDSGSPKSDWNQVSEDICRDVLLKMKLLKCLDISKSSSSLISEPTLEELRRLFVVLCEASNIVKVADD